MRPTDRQRMQRGHIPSSLLNTKGSPRRRNLPGSPCNPNCSSTTRGSGGNPINTTLSARCASGRWQFFYAVEAARGVGDSGSTRCPRRRAGRLARTPRRFPPGDFPPWRSNYLAYAAWPASSSWNALHRRPRRAVPAAPGLPRASRQRRTQRRAMQFGARMKMRWYPTAAGHAPRARRCGRSPAARSTLSPSGGKSNSFEPPCSTIIERAAGANQTAAVPGPYGIPQDRAGGSRDGVLRPHHRPHHARLRHSRRRGWGSSTPSSILHCGTPSTRLPGGPATISSHGSVRWTPFWFPRTRGG